MNGADWAIVAILAISVVIGLWRGLVREALSLATWLVAVFASIAFGSQVAGLYEAWIEVPSVRIALGYATVFIVMLLVGGLVGWLAGRLVRSSGLSGTDRMLGLGFGMARGIVVVALLILAMSYTPLQDDPWWRESALIPRVEPVAVWLRDMLPEALSGLREAEALPALAPPAGESTPIPL